MEDKVVLSVLSWVPTADQINSIKPDQSVGNWSGSVGMSGIAEVHLGSLEIRKMSCGGRKKSCIPFLFQGSMSRTDGQTAEINTISPDKLNILMPAAATAVVEAEITTSKTKTNTK
ncbi:hypothetical protein DPMN_023242 [Dreissena polymorpha]|uniref:Uncharacterized protein n=1 Tax=Dreissena polymorpha TaxID=45954 RepID=A0A9D4LLZ8_DREPO|nr:hypothetical protein DPMN_023242 [Dreissena polymorpha]